LIINIASLKRISETIPNCECLIQLHDLLSKNKVFANKYMMVFNKPIISKIETYIQTDSNGNSYIRARVTNPNTDSRTILQNTFYNNVKNNIITNRVPTAREKFRIYDRYKNTPHANLYLYDAFKEIFPDINQASFNLAIAKIGRVAMANNLINFANVIIANNNIHKPLAVLLYEGLTQQEKRDKFIDGIKDNIKEAVNKGYKEVPEVYSKYISDEYFQPFMNTPFENNTIYTINDKFYLNINGTTAINLSDDLKQYKAKYPNIEDNKLGLFIEINENEINRVTSNTDRYSSVDDQTPIGRFAKNASLIISRAVSLIRGLG
jgi:hypothetical protein